MSHNIIGIGAKQLQVHNDLSARSRVMDQGSRQGAQSGAQVDQIQVSTGASQRTQEVSKVSGPELTGMPEALKLAHNTVRMMLERPDQAMKAHVPDLGARVAGLMA